MESMLKNLMGGHQDENLIPYLEDLHQKGLASPEHITLLLNTYIKAEDYSRLEAFVKGTSQVREDSGESEDGKADAPVKFNAAAAINVLRQANLYKYAASLALRFEEHQDYLRIQIEDLKDYNEAISHLHTLSPELCSLALKEFLRTLLTTSVQEEVVAILALLCAGRYRPKLRGKDASVKVNEVETDPSKAKNYLRFMSLGKRPATSSLNSYVDDAIQAIQQATVPSYDVPSLRLFQCSFIDFPVAHIRFLETVAELRYDVSIDPQIAIVQDDKLRNRNSMTVTDVDMEKTTLWDTLIELYLASDDQMKAVAILKSEKPRYHHEQALLNCFLMKCIPGSIYLLELNGQYYDILQLCRKVTSNTPMLNAALYSARGKEVQSPCLKAVYRYGEKEPALNVEVLKMVVASPELLKDIGDDALLNIVEEVDRHKLLSVLEIVKELSRTKIIAIGTIRGWLIERLGRDREDRTINKRLAESYRQSNADLQARLDDFNDPRKPKVIQEDTCASCRKQLDLPTIHYLCGHSFHERCLDDAVKDCPIDHEALASIRAHRQSQKEIAADQDQFFYHLDRAQDKMSAIIEHGFGQGLMSFVTNFDSTSLT